MTQPREKRFGTRAGVCLLFGMLLFAALLLTATRASAASVVASGDCGANGSNVKWSLDSDGTLTISGQGEMTTSWSDYKDSIRTVVIKKGVTRINDYNFHSYKKLSSITIPNSVKSIGYSAFSFCERLINITIPNSVTSIENNAFQSCKSLTSIKIPDGVVNIGENTFCDCNHLVSATISNSVTNIGKKAFSGCISLTRITVDSKNKYYSSDADGCLYNKDKSTFIQYPIGKPNTSYSISKTVTTIGESAFYYCKGLKSLTIPNSVTSIGNSAFCACVGLTKITISNRVNNIGDFAFNFCESLKSFSIPHGVTQIGHGVFYNCYSLKNITIPNSVTSIGDSAFSSCESLTSVTIPNSVRSIGAWAFCNCESLTSVMIPNSVTSIGKIAFSGCDRLKSVTVSNSVTNIAYLTFGYCIHLKKLKVLNRNCQFESNCFQNSPNIVLYGYSGSTTQTYAKNNSIKFVALTEPHTHTYGAVKVTKATMTKDGARTKTCSICGKKAVVTIPRISTVKLAQTSCAYTGKAITPTVTVKDSDGKGLTKGTDYTLAYAKGRTAVGTYTVKVTFKGNYTGSKKLNFKIVPGQVTGLKQQKRPGINFEWQNVKGADRYEVYGDVNSVGKFELLDTVNSTSFGNSSIAKGTIMKFKVRAVATGSDGKLYKGAFSAVLTAVARS